jgi:hypothetical protein
MYSHKADKHMTYGELYHDDQSVFVSFDVKHIMLVGFISRPIVRSCPYND